MALANPAQGAALRVSSGGALRVSSGGALRVSSGGALRVSSGRALRVSSGLRLSPDDGGAESGGMPSERGEDWSAEEHDEHEVRERAGCVPRE